MTKLVSPYKDGATIQVAHGVLRGVGPMGPRGHQGIQGPPGPQGIPGPQPEMLPVTGHFNTADPITVSADGQWVLVPMTGNTYLVGEIGSLQPGGGILLEGVGASGMASLLSPQVTLMSNAVDTADFNFEVGLFLGAAGAPFASTSFRHSNGVTANTYSFTAQMLVAANTEIFLKIRTWAVASPTVSSAVVAISRAGGPKGPAGPTGPEGPVGDQGIQGLPGDSGTGYGTFDTLVTGGGSDNLPAGSPTTGQGLPYPTGAMSPAIPAYIKNLADNASKWIVRRFTSSTDILTATDVASGQVAYVTGNASYQGVVEIAGVKKLGIIAQVMYGTGDPPAGTHPAGTIYIKVA